MDSLAGLYLVLANTCLNCFREQAWTDRRSCFLWHSEEPVSCDRGSYPLQEVLSPSLGHSDSAASSPGPQITAGMWSRSWWAGPSLLSFCLNVQKGELVGATGRTGAPWVETPPCSSLSLPNIVSEPQGRA